MENVDPFGVGSLLHYESILSVLISVWFASSQACEINRFSRKMDDVEPARTDIAKVATAQPDEIEELKKDGVDETKNVGTLERRLKSRHIQFLALSGKDWSLMIVFDFFSLIIIIINYIMLNAVQVRSEPASSSARVRSSRSRALVRRSSRISSRASISSVS